MAIREKCLQTSLVALPYADDFALHFVVPREHCVHVPLAERPEHVFFSMGVNTRVRKDYAQHFVNQQFADAHEYFQAIRRHRFGISIWGGGILCQRDGELAGNTLLCRARFPRYTREYDPLDYADGMDCIEFADLEDLKSKMAHYEANPAEYERLLQACYEKTMNCFTAEAQAERLLQWALKA
jgi:hypothetical protein